MRLVEWLARCGAALVPVVAVCLLLAVPFWVLCSALGYWLAWAVIALSSAAFLGTRDFRRDAN